MNKIHLTNSVLLAFVVLVLVSSSACTSSSNNVNPQVTTDKRPELTEEKIRETINDARVRNVPEVANASKPISWNFDSDEPKEFKAIETQVDGDKATVVMDLMTRSAADARNPQELSGKIRLHYELQRGWVLRQWQIVKVENISMTYKNLVKPEPMPDSTKEGLER
ncbi:MAG: hypothetical protein MSG64_18660 [Pyrinomonadaceae bacterium MAG19_C2-C3]|nr:hypothetical protein [Pyrinomonadaceae bacterium MAG19_C2-C3]